MDSNNRYRSKGNKKGIFRLSRIMSVIAVIFAIATVILLTGFLFKACKARANNTGQVQIEKTPAVIEDIKPVGEIYLQSLVAEDFVTKQEKEYHLHLIPEDHSCVQILSQKVSYKLDLSKVTYIQDSTDVVKVIMPEVEYVASTQDSKFMSDDESYWKATDTNIMKAQVANKIKQKYDTAEARRRANENAKNVITELLGKFGFKVEFVNNGLERKLE